MHMPRGQTGFRRNDKALKSRHTAYPEGSHRWDIDSRNDALLLSFRYSPRAPQNTKDSVMCRFMGNRMDVIYRNKDEAKNIIKYETFPAIIREVTKSVPDVQEIVFPYSEFMSDTLKEFCENSEYNLERRVHHPATYKPNAPKESFFLLSLRLPQPQVK
jgi:hypothetical protein